MEIYEELDRGETTLVIDFSYLETDSGYFFALTPLACIPWFFLANRIAYGEGVRKDAVVNLLEAQR